MIAEAAIILVLLLVIIGLVYQFMFDVWLFVLIGASIFYVLFLSVEIVAQRHKKRLKAGSLDTPAAEPVKKPAPEAKPSAKLSAEPKPIAKPALDKDLQKLVSFIKKNLNQGFKEKIIRQALNKQGWPKTKIDKAFKSLK